MRETAVEKYLVRRIKEIGGRAPKWTSPGNRGVPDRLVILSGGRTVYVETKAPGKPLKPLQRKWAETLANLGHQVFKIDSFADVDQFIEEVMPK